MNITQQIITISIHLAQNKGARMDVANLNGFVERFENDEFEIIYVTPFSGAEIYPGQKAYMIDIWQHRKKVFSIYYSRFDDLVGTKKRPRGEWVNKLMALDC